MWASDFAKTGEESASCGNSKRKRRSNGNDLAKPPSVYISLCNDSLGSNSVVCRIVVVKYSVSATVHSALDVQDLFGSSQVHI